MIDTPTKAAQAQAVTGTGEMGYFAGLFTALKNATAGEFIQEGLGRFIFFPVALLIGVIKAGFAMYDFVKAKNKNMHRAAGITLELLAIGLIAVAVLGSVFAHAAFAMITPILFTVALGIKALYDSAMAIFHGIKFLNCKDEATKALHKAEFKKHGVQALIGLAITACVALAMVFHYPAALIAAAVVSGAGLVVGLGRLIYARIHRNDTLESEAQPLLAKTDADPALSNDYFYSRNRTMALLSMADEAAKTDFLKTEIKAKVAELTVSDQEGSLSAKLQHSKRAAKIEALTELGDLIETAPKNKAVQLRRMVEDYKHKDVFQSFFKHKSDVADIFDAAEVAFKPTIAA